MYVCHYTLQEAIDMFPVGNIIQCGCMFECTTYITIQYTCSTDKIYFEAKISTLKK